LDSFLAIQNVDLARETRHLLAEAAHFANDLRELGLSLLQAFAAAMDARPDLLEDRLADVEASETSSAQMFGHCAFGFSNSSDPSQQSQIPSFTLWEGRRRRFAPRFGQ
jgi:hypothetical protein